MKTFLTIIVQTYNREKGLIRNLSALNDQSDKNFRLVIFNNGAKYNIDVILNKFENLVDKTFIHNEENNIGLVKARNKAVSFVDTEFFARIDDDDFAEKDYVKKVNKLLNNGTDLVIVTSKNNPKEHSDKTIYSWGPWRYIIRKADFLPFPDILPEDFLSPFYYLSISKKVSFNEVNITLPSDDEFKKDYIFSDKYEEYAFYWIEKIKDKNMLLNCVVDFYWMPGFISKKINKIGTFAAIEKFVLYNRIFSIKSKYESSTNKAERKFLANEYKKIKKICKKKVVNFTAMLIWSKMYVFFHGIFSTKREKRVNG